MKIAVNEENQLVVDIYELVDSMPSEVKKRLGILLANQGDVLKHCIELISEGVSYDSLGRWYYPASDEMQGARLMLIDRFDDVQARAVEEANSQRDSAKRDADHYRQREWALLDAIESLYGDTVRSRVLDHARHQD